MKKNSYYHVNNAVSLVDFQRIYGTEEACEQKMFQMKWANGYKCPKCGHEHYSVVKGRRLPLYQCKKCGHQTTVTVGTIFENSKLPLVKWFLGLYFVATCKTGISQTALAKFLGISEPSSWLMLHKIRAAMGEREGLYLLGGSVEMDEAFFGGVKEGGRCGSGTSKIPAAVALELSKNGYPIHLKIDVIPNAIGKTLLEFAKRHITPGATIHTDGLVSYNKLRGDYDVDMRAFDPKDESDHLKWLHIMISNIKANILGAYHGLIDKYLQRYFDEFCWRFNRRHSKKPLVEHLMECCVWSTYRKHAELCL